MRSSWVLLALIIVLPTSAAQSGCDAFSISPSALAADATQGNGVVYINGPDGCRYALTVRHDYGSFVGPWLSLGQDTARVTARSVGVNVYWQDNAGEHPRTGIVDVAPEGGSASQAFSVEQAPRRNDCVRSAAPTSFSFRAEGGSGVVVVDAAEGCPYWVTWAGADWMRFPYGTLDGPQDLPLTVDPNDGPPRTAQATVAGRIVTIDQENAIGERPVRDEAGHEVRRGLNPLEEALVDETPSLEPALVLAVALAAALAARRRAPKR